MRRPAKETSTLEFNEDVPFIPADEPPKFTMEPSHYCSVTIPQPYEIRLPAEIWEEIFHCTTRISESRCSALKVKRIEPLNVTYHRGPQILRTKNTCGPSSPVFQSYWYANYGTRLASHFYGQTFESISQHRVTIFKL